MEKKFKLSVENEIHEGLQKAIQQIWDEYKVCIRTISVQWIDLSNATESRMILTGLDMGTSTKVGRAD